MYEAREKYFCRYLRGQEWRKMGAYACILGLSLSPSHIGLPVLTAALHFAGIIGKNFGREPLPCFAYLQLLTRRGLKGVILTQKVS